MTFDLHNSKVKASVTTCINLINEGTQAYSQTIVELIRYREVGQKIRDSLDTCQVLDWECNQDELPVFVKSIIRDAKHWRENGGLTQFEWLGSNIEFTVNEAFKEFNKLIDQSAVILYDTDSISHDNEHLSFSNLNVMVSFFEDRVKPLKKSRYPDINPDSIIGAQSFFHKISTVDKTLEGYVNHSWFKSGFYYKNGEVYRIRRTGSNAKFELSWMVTGGETPIFADAPPAIIKKLIFVNPMTEQEVLDLSHKHKFCAICGRPIEVKESIERGMGPVCFDRLKRMDIDTTKAREARV